MNSNVIIIIVFIIFIAQIISGCFDDHHNIPKYDLYVDDDYDSQTPGWGVDHFDTIYEALNASVENTSIFVYGGIYNKTLVIDKKITLKGEGAFITIIDGTHKREDAIHIEGNGRATISGFTIKNCGDADKYPSNDAGIDIRSSGNTITENIFINNTYGIYTMYADGNNVTNNKFINNYEYGVCFYTSSDDNEISENIFLKNHHALRIKGSVNCTVRNNVFLNNDKGLYVCCGSMYNIMYGNVFCNNSEWDAYDHSDNSWDSSSVPSYWHHLGDAKLNGGLATNESIGNYWDSFHLETQGAYDNNSDGIIDIPYNIPDVNNHDNYPLADPPAITNIFFEEKELTKECS